MNIGIVTTWFERGAAYVSRQFKEILEAENNVFIYARGGEEYAIGNPEWDLDSVYWAKKVKTPFFAGTVIDKSDFIKWIQKNKIELIIFNEQHWFRPILWCKELKIKTVSYIDYYTEKTLPLFAAYDALICNTKKHYSAFSWHKGALYLPWGTDINMYKPTNKAGLVNDNYVTFFHSAGYLGIRKGTDLLILALKKTKFVKKLIIHTQSDLYELYPDLADIMDELKSEGRLEIIHKTVPAPGLYCLGDVYVYPTRLEGIGLTIAESISSGLVPVVPDNGPMNEFVNCNFGYLIKIDRFISRSDGYYWPKCEVDIDNLVEIMDDLAQNPEKVLHLKQEARNYAESSLDFSKNASILNSLVKDVCFTNNDMAKRKIDSFENEGLAKLNKIIIKYNSLYRFLALLMRK